MQRQGLNGKVLGIAAVGVIILAVIIFSLLSSSSAPQPTAGTENGTSTQTTESKDVVANTTAPQQSGPDYTPLLNAGVATKQIDALQYALYLYAQPTKIPVTNITVTPGSVTHELPNPDAGTDFNTYNFTVKYDDSHTYKAIMETTGLSKIRLFLNDNSGARIFDSKEVDGTAL